VRAFAIINAVVAGLNALVWLGLAWIGWGLLKGVEGQHVAGYPNRGQFVYYLWFPLAMAACAFGLYMVAHSTRFRAPAILTHALMFFVLLFFLLGYGGGV
jgi:hypothetical protein